MRKLLAALGLLGGLWASNVTATILSFDVIAAVTTGSMCREALNTQNEY